MAKKLAPGFYEVSPTETLTFTVTGPDDPLAAFDDSTLEVREATPFAITPQMLGGVGAHHYLAFVLLFPTDGTATQGYVITFADANGQIDAIRKEHADVEHSAKVDVMVRVQ
jgi:hypothetical protein